MDKAGDLFQQLCRVNVARFALLLSLVFTASVQCVSQCPPTPRIPDPPGLAIDRGSGKGIFHEQLSDDGRWIAFDAQGAIYLMNVQTGIRRMLIPCIEVMAQAMAFNQDSSLLAVGTANGVIYLFDVATGSQKAEFRDPDAVLPK